MRRRIKFTDAEKARRNSKLVGNNSASYNEKHPTNPISQHPIRAAINRVPKLTDSKGNQYPNYKEIARLRSLGSVHWFGKQRMEALSFCRE